MTVRVRRRPLPALVFVVSALVTSVTWDAAADEASPKRVVFYVEAVGIDVGIVRTRLRDSIPDRVIPLDAVDFRAAMTAKGQKGPLRLALGTAKDRAVLFERMRQVASEMHADGVVFVNVNDAPKRRLVKIIVLSPKEESPALDQLVVLEPATAKSDPAKIKVVLGPVLERLGTAAVPSVAPPPEPAAETPAAEAPPPPVEPVAPPSGPPPPAAPVLPVAKPIAPRPPVRGSVSLELFPAGVSPNYAHAKLIVPLSKALAVMGHVGAGYLPLPADDAALVLGGGLRLALGPGWSVEPSGFYARFPKYLTWYQGGLRIGAAFGETEARPPTVRLTLASSVTRWLWKPDLGAPGAELIEGHAQLEFQLRPIRPLTIAPAFGYFLYDRSLLGSKPAIGAVALSLAPYPIQAFFGGTVGYDFGHWTPYVGARHFLYTAGIGSGSMVGPGLRFANGPDFVDARIGVFISNTKGPLSSRLLDSVPMVVVDMGWAF